LNMKDDGGYWLMRVAIIAAPVLAIRTRRSLMIGINGII
jgi:hypothetical protein